MYVPHIECMEQLLSCRVEETTITKIGSKYFFNRLCHCYDFLLAKALTQMFMYDIILNIVLNYQGCPPSPCVF